MNSIIKYVHSIYLSGLAILIAVNFNRPLPDIGVRCYLILIFASLGLLWFTLARVDDRKGI